jgi:hypothetical protein
MNEVANEILEFTTRDASPQRMESEAQSNH